MQCTLKCDIPKCCRQYIVHICCVAQGPTSEWAADGFLAWKWVCESVLRVCVCVCECSVCACVLITLFCSLAMNLGVRQKTLCHSVAPGAHSTRCRVWVQEKKEAGPLRRKKKNSNGFSDKSNTKSETQCLRDKKIFSHTAQTEFGTTGGPKKKKKSLP